jgi:hypothetical protein
MAQLPTWACQLGLPHSVTPTPSVYRMRVARWLSLVAQERLKTVRLTLDQAFRREIPRQEDCILQDLAANRQVETSRVI